jgi:peptidoglycan hydrolase-like protein with peptidoglycan-binding domain
MKKIFIGVMLVALMFVCAPTPAFAVTIAELQAMIASLTAQLNVLVGLQNGSGGTIPIINPTGTSTGLIVFSERPTLKLVYDKNKSESKLEGKGVVTVQAGANDVLLANVNLKITDVNGKYAPIMLSSFDLMSGATQEEAKTSDGFLYKVWRISANSKASFSLSLTANPQIMFAGSYNVSLAEPSTVNAVTGYYQSGTLAYEDSKSLPVTIIGEKSPYISAFEFTPTQVVLTGVRFSMGDKVYVNGVRKGVLTKLEGTTRTAISPDWLEKYNDENKCSIYGTVQIENSKTGKSNNFWVGKDCGGTISNFSEIIARSISSDSVVRKSVTGGSDEGVFTYRAELTAKNGDVYIPDSVIWVGSNMNRNFDYGVNLAIEKNGVVVDLDQYSPSVSYDLSNAKKVGKYWLIKKGDTSQIVVTVVIGNIKQTGIYRASMVGFAYNNKPSNNNYRTHSINAGRFATQQIALNGSFPTQPISVCPVLTKNLTVGSSGTEVTALQNFLIAKGYLISTTAVSTGYFGVGTRDALAKYQTAKGLSPADGYLGAITREVIRLDCSGTTPAKPTITITSPNGGGYYAKNSPMKVTWTTNIPQTEYLDVIRLRAYPNGQEYYLAGGVLNTGGTNVTIPSNVPAGAYTLEIKTYTKGNGVLVMDASDSYFKITDSSVTPPIISPTSPMVLYPNGGEILTLAKDSILVNFKPVIGINHSINLVDSSGGTYSLATGITGQPTASQSIGISTSIIKNYGLGNGKYKIEICGQLGCDLSDNYFTLESPIAIQPLIKVLSPNGGENIIQEGHQYPITWSGNSISTVFVNLVPANSPGNGVGTLGIIGSVSSGNVIYWDAKTVWTDLHNGTPIIVPPGIYKVHLVGNVVNLTGQTVSDMSDNYFTITSPVVVQPTTATSTTTTGIKTCYVGRSIFGGVRWEVKSCTSNDYLEAPANLKKEVIATSQAEQLKSIAAALQAIKELLKSL